MSLTDKKYVDNTKIININLINSVLIIVFTIPDFFDLIDASYPGLNGMRAFCRHQH